MAGNFVAQRPEFNVQKDTASARKLFERWPGEIVASGFEIGQRLLFPAAHIEHDFAWTPDHPVAEAYRNYQKMPYDRPTWDLTAVLYGVRQDAAYFGLSPKGRITADDMGRTQWTADPGGRHRYLVLEEEQRARALEALELLASQPR